MILVLGPKNADQSISNNSECKVVLKADTLHWWPSFIQVLILYQLHSELPSPRFCVKIRIITCTLLAV